MKSLNYAHLSNVQNVSNLLTMDKRHFILTELLREAKNTKQDRNPFDCSKCSKDLKLNIFSQVNVNVYALFIVGVL